MPLTATWLDLVTSQLSQITTRAGGFFWEQMFDFSDHLLHKEDRRRLVAAWDSVEVVDTSRRQIVKVRDENEIKARSNRECV
uniref:Uncharacterized protein n=1 Tax=Strigamia maritima TaxID=126957 RepID=T1IML5_STRMM